LFNQLLACLIEDQRVQGFPKGIDPSNSTALRSALLVEQIFNEPLLYHLIISW